MRKLTSLLAGLVLVIGTTSVLEAQATRGGTGVMLGVGGTYTLPFDLQGGEEFDNEDVRVDGGFGFAARAGFAFTPVFVIFGGFEQSWHGLDEAEDDAQLQHLFGGVRINLPVAPSLAPYLSGGYGQRRISADFDDPDFGTANLRLTGNFFDVGGGIQIFMNRSLTFDAGVNYSFGAFDEARLLGDTFGIDDVDANVFRLRVGLTWMPMTDR